MAASLPVSVSVVYSPAPRQLCEVHLSLPSGSTVLQALQASGFLEQFLLPSFARIIVGVWGRKTASSQTLRENDRVEIYRPLTVDPKVARRERFAKQGSRSAGLFVKKRPGAKSGY